MCHLGFLSVTWGVVFLALSAPYDAHPALQSCHSGSLGIMGKVPRNCVTPIISRYW